MVTDEQVRWIALFFLFSSMDETHAIQSAQKVIVQLKAHGSPSSLTRIEILKAIRKVWDAYLKTPTRRRSPGVPEHSWRLPDHIEIAPWVKFQKDASSEQVTAVVLTKILGFSESEIAEGFGLSLGTSRYRVSRGVKQLGSVMKATGY